VRFICFEILATGVLAFECLRNSACIVLVQATFVRFTLFAILFSVCVGLLSCAALSYNDFEAIDSLSFVIKVNRGRIYRFSIPLSTPRQLQHLSRERARLVQSGIAANRWQT
jgi:hypothetical protein